MRCFVCGGDMEETHVEPDKTVPDFAFYSFRCQGCGDTESRLLPLRRATVPESLTAGKTNQPSRPTPRQKLTRDEGYRLGLRASGKTPEGISNAHGQAPLNELLKDPRKFIDAFIRERKLTDQ